MQPNREAPGLAPQGYAKKVLLACTRHSTYSPSMLACQLHILKAISFMSHIASCVPVQSAIVVIGGAV